MKYAFNVYKTQVEDHVFWIAESRDLKGCVGQGETMEEALTELALNEEEWLETAKEVGINIPEQCVEKMPSYSGKFMVRVSSRVHQDASEQAKKQGISLNQYVNDAIVTMNASCSTVDCVKGVVNEMRELFYSSSGQSSYKSDKVIPYPASTSGNVSFENVLFNS